MAIKINVGINKKIGQPNFGSRGASCNVDFELDGNLENENSARFQEAVSVAYSACREAVESELSTKYDNDDSVHASTIGERKDATSGRNTRNGIEQKEGGVGLPVRQATASQVRAIYAIANRHQIDLHAVLSQRFQIECPEKLSIGDASDLIDQLKKSVSGNGVRQ